MKIGPLENKLAVTGLATERKASGTGNTTARSEETSAKVAISAQASALAATTEDGSFDAGKVERVSQSLRDGTFKVNPEAIADKLISNAQELLARTYR